MAAHKVRTKIPNNLFNDLLSYRSGKGQSKLFSIDIDADRFVNLMQKSVTGVVSLQRDNKLAMLMATELLKLSKDLVPYRNEYRLKKLSDKENKANTSHTIKTELIHKRRLRARSADIKRFKLEKLNKSSYIAQTRRFNTGKQYTTTHWSSYNKNNQDYYSKETVFHYAHSSKIKHTTTVYKTGKQILKKRVYDKDKDGNKLKTYKMVPVQKREPKYEDYTDVKETKIVNPNYQPIYANNIKYSNNKTQSNYINQLAHIVRYGANSYHDPTLDPDKYYRMRAVKEGTEGAIKSERMVDGKRKTVWLKQFEDKGSLFADRPPHLRDKGKVRINSNGLANIYYSVRKKEDKRYAKTKLNEYAGNQYYGMLFTDEGTKQGDKDWNRFTDGTTSRWLEVAIGKNIPNVKIRNYPQGKANYAKLVNIVGSVVEKKLNGAK